MDPLYDNRRYLIPFRSTLLPQVFTDTLVLGAGSAGLSAALEASKHGDVIVLSKGGPEASNTAHAQGGIAAALDANDSADAHLADTLEAGAGLCDPEAVDCVVKRGPEIMRALLDNGFRADRDSTGEIAFGREGGHRERRIVHSAGDATGKELSRCLIEQVEARRNIRLFHNCFSLDLLSMAETSGSLCTGAMTHHERYGLQIIWAKATILASGGAGVVWRETTNPASATADGLAMGYRAGASLADLAFMQFHPTTLYIAGAPRFLISEAVRGEGALLLDANHQRFMEHEHELAELAPRDVVSRAMHRVLSRQPEPYIWLDARPVNNFADRFPSIAAMLRRFDLDASRDPIPVNPAAHYMVGGLRTDLQGRTDIPGLYAAGEVASTGLHGANRLASNSLLESLVMGAAAGKACREMLAENRSENTWGVTVPSGPVSIVSDVPISISGEIDLTDIRSSLRSAMWRNVGIERTGKKLTDVADMFDFWGRYTLDKIFDEPRGWETQNMLLAGALVTRSASWRCESRGCHARDDFPGSADEFVRHDLWRKGRNEPVTIGNAVCAV